MKKILIAVIIALLLVIACRYDFVGIAENIIVKYENTKLNDCIVKVDGKSVKLGMSEKEITALFGTPYDILPSEYGFNWNIYHKNFQNYIQIGINDGVVVGIYTNSPEFSLGEISSGAKKEAVASVFGSSLDGIVKGKTRYLTNGAEDSANSEIYRIRGGYITFFYDTHANNLLSSVNIIDYNTEQEFNTLYAQGTNTLKKSFEMQNFYVTNATRVKFGLTPFKYNEELKKLAFLHSLDMVENKYFSHYTLNGDSVLERAQKQNVDFNKIGENLAMGAQNSLYSHELLMNSKGHRDNILADFSDIGIGVAFDEKSTPYLTQNFLK